MLASWCVIGLLIPTTASSMFCGGMMEYRFCCRYDLWLTNAEGFLGFRKKCGRPLQNSSPVWVTRIEFSESVEYFACVVVLLLSLLKSSTCSPTKCKAPIACWIRSCLSFKDISNTHDIVMRECGSTYSLNQYYTRNCFVVVDSWRRL